MSDFRNNMFPSPEQVGYDILVQELARQKYDLYMGGYNSDRLAVHPHALTLSIVWELDYPTVLDALHEDVASAYNELFEPNDY